MKKLYSTIMLLAMMVAALSFTACGSDDGGNGNGGSGSGFYTGDFIELTIDGKTYKKNLIGIYTEIELSSFGYEGLTLTSTTEDVFCDEGFRFFMGLSHYSSSSKLLSSSTGSYNVHTKSNNDSSNLCLFVQFQKNSIDYDAESGTHKVTSIKQVSNGVQVSGTFNITLKRNSNTKMIEGKYTMTL